MVRKGLKRGQNDSSSGSVFKSSVRQRDILQEKVAGALVSFCAGCMLEVNRSDGMQQLGGLLSQSLGAQPFLAMFPFGEQGFFANKQRSGIVPATQPL